MMDQLSFFGFLFATYFTFIKADSPLCGMLVNSFGKTPASLCDRPKIGFYCPTWLDSNCPEQAQKWRSKQAIWSNNKPQQQDQTSGGHNGDNDGAALEDQIKQCCREQGVKENCMKFCSYDSKNSEDVSCHTECAEELKRTLYCAANGKQNGKCCINNGLPQAQCQSLCNGRAPKVEEVFGNLGAAVTYLPCLNNGKIIMKCHKQNAPTQKNWEIKEWGGPEPFPAAMKPFADNFCQQSKGK